MSVLRSVNPRAYPRFVTKAGVGYGVDETQKVVDDGKGWVWLAAEMSPGGGSTVLLWDCQAFCSGGSHSSCSPEPICLGHYL